MKIIKDLTLEDFTMNYYREKFYESDIYSEYGFKITIFEDSCTGVYWWAMNLENDIGEIAIWQDGDSSSPEACLKDFKCNFPERLNKYIKYTKKIESDMGGLL